MASRTVNPKKGDIIRFRRLGYDHYGIYVGNGKVIHRVGVDGKMSSLNPSGDGAIIREDDLNEVADGDEAMIANYYDGEKKPFSPDEIVSRARSQLGKKGYNLVTKNCEHFVTWCRNGVENSEQVNSYLRLAANTNPMFFSINVVLAALGRGPIFQ